MNYKELRRKTFEALAKALPTTPDPRIEKLINEIPAELAGVSISELIAETVRGTARLAIYAVLSQFHTNDSTLMNIVKKVAGLVDDGETYFRK